MSLPPSFFVPVAVAQLAPYMVGADGAHRAAPNVDLCGRPPPPPPTARAPSSTSVPAVLPLSPLLLPFLHPYDDGDALDLEPRAGCVSGERPHGELRRGRARQRPRLQRRAQRHEHEQHEADEDVEDEEDEEDEDDDEDADEDGDEDEDELHTAALPERVFKCALPASSCLRRPSLSQPLSLSVSLSLSLSQPLSETLPWTVHSPAALSKTTQQHRGASHRGVGRWSCISGASGPDEHAAGPRNLYKEVHLFNERPLFNEKLLFNEKQHFNEERPRSR